MDRNDERIKRALRRRPYRLNQVRVNSPDSVLWPSGKVHRRPKPATSVQTLKIHKRPDQTSEGGWNINSEPLSQSGRMTRLIERNYDDVISSSNSDDMSIYSYTHCESECDDEGHERRRLPLKVQDEEDGKVTKLEAGDMVQDDDLSLQSFDESDFLRDDGNDSSTEDSPEPPKEPQGPLKDHQLSPWKVSGPVSGKTGLSPLVTSAPRTQAETLWALSSAVAPPSPENVLRPLTHFSPVIIAPPATENLAYRRSPRLAPITNLSKNSRKLLQEMSGVAAQRMLLWSPRTSPRT